MITDIINFLPSLGKYLAKIVFINLDSNKTTGYLCWVSLLAISVVIRAHDWSKRLHVDNSPCMCCVCVCVFTWPQAISCVVQIASIRRSLFTTVERSNFLTQIVKGVIGILEQPQVSGGVGCGWMVLCSVYPMPMIGDRCRGGAGWFSVLCTQYL